MLYALQALYSMTFKIKVESQQYSRFMGKSLGFTSGYFISLGIISIILDLWTVLTPDIPYIYSISDIQ